VEDEHESMAAPKGPDVAGGEDEAALWDAIRGLEGRLEEEAAIIAKVAKEGRVVAADEVGVGDEAKPAAADGRCAREGGG
jgi:hypothetical protein